MSFQNLFSQNLTLAVAIISVASIMTIGGIVLPVVEWFKRRYHLPTIIKSIRYETIDSNMEMPSGSCYREIKVVFPNEARRMPSSVIVRLNYVEDILYLRPDSNTVRRPVLGVKYTESRSGDGVFPRTICMAGSPQIVSKWAKRDLIVYLPISARIVVNNKLTICRVIALRDLEIGLAPKMTTMKIIA